MKHSYDEIAQDYTEFFSKQEYVDEDDKLVELVKSLCEIKGKILEIGCGNGRVTKKFNFQPDNYIGIDPSENMLNIFKETNLKHIHTSFEDFKTDEKFDFIFSLYGSPSYIKPHYLSKISELLNPKGWFFLMFYADGYIPITHEIFNIDMKIYNSPRFGMKYGNYVIWYNQI